MEVIKLEKYEIAGQFSGNNNLGEVIQALEAIAKERNQVICRVKVNGLQFTESDEVKFASTKIKDIDNIEVELEKIDQLIGNTIASLLAYTKILKEKVIKAADLFRAQEANASRKLFSEIVIGAQHLADALISLKGNYRSVDMTSHFDEEWARAERHMMNSAKELIAAYESQDFVLVSDVLEYELSTSLDVWNEILNTVS